MGILTFKTAELRLIADDAEVCWKAHAQVRTYMSQFNEQGFWLVGDRGIYMMHNGKLLGAKPKNVAYAAESNPESGAPFDEWYQAKRDLFGGDDGVDFTPRQNFLDWLRAGEIAGAETLQVEITPETVALVMPVIRTP